MSSNHVQQVQWEERRGLWFYQDCLVLVNEAQIWWCKFTYVCTDWCWELVFTVQHADCSLHIWMNLDSRFQTSMIVSQSHKIFITLLPKTTKTIGNKENHIWCKRGNFCSGLLAFIKVLKITSDSSVPALKWAGILLKAVMKKLEIRFVQKCHGK